MKKATVLQLWEDICAFWQYTVQTSTFSLFLLFQELADFFRLCIISLRLSRSQPNRSHLQVNSNSKTNYSLFKSSCTICSGGCLRTRLKKIKSDHPPSQERPHRKECVFLLSDWWSHLSAVCIPPLIKLSSVVPLLPSFLWANLNLSIRSPGATLSVSLHWSPVFFCYVSTLSIFLF